MATHDKIELLYKEINRGCYSTVKHYELVKPKRPHPLIAKFLNIQDARGYSKSKPRSWVKYKIGENWSTPVTGLFQIPIQGYFFNGDLDQKNHLVIFEFSVTGHQLKITLFPNFYPFDKNWHPITVSKRIPFIKGLLNDK